MKKGRHRRFEEARALKRTSDDLDALLGDRDDPCPECDTLPGDEHASWCRYEESLEADDSTRW